MSELFFTLEIASPTINKKVSIEWIEIESTTGSFFVGPHHSPLISIMKPQGSIAYKEVNGTTTTVEISSGIFIINNNRAIVLLDR